MAAIAIITAVAAITLLAACDVSVSDGSGAPASGAVPTGDERALGEQATADLATLRVATANSMKGYSRDRFPHWSDQGDGCDTRDVVLKRDGSNVKIKNSCTITSGKWTSVYDNKTFTDPGKLDIDHMVPLANAWRSGADSWEDTKRSSFANDLTRPQLLAVSATTNRSKGDQDPSQWTPPNKAYWCVYATKWITVKSQWDLTVTAAEKSKLAEMLETCT
ncbi:MAG: HNH endonuclease [Micromonosporaceae bacterium]|nr:HNH endonuclease [Micromonosporaceae bacterium]